MLGKKSDIPKSFFDIQELEKISINDISKLFLINILNSYRDYK